MAAEPVFLDTNGWLALLNASDVLHRAAAAEWARVIEQRSAIVLTDWVVAETGNGLARTAARSRFAAAVEILRASPRVRLVPVSEHLFARALELYGGRPDKTWGLVDCASFLIMQDEGIREAFTNDRHFGQAGFRPLLPVL